MAEIEMEFLATYEFLAPIRSFTEKLLEVFSGDDKTKAVFPLAVQEVLTNIIEHSYEGRGGPIKIMWEVNNKGIKVRFIFAGKRIKIPEEVFDLEEKIRMRRTRGFGLEIVRRISHRMEYGYGKEGNWWEIERKFRN